MDKAFTPQLLPLSVDQLDFTMFFNELIEANVKLEVYKEKIKDSKLDPNWFMPTLQHKEALASSLLEGTQATLDGVLINQVAPEPKNKNLREVANYFEATTLGYRLLNRQDFSNEFFFEIHSTLLDGDVRKIPTYKTGEYRKQQNYIGKNEGHAITYVPPEPEKIKGLMDNLISYINNPKDDFNELLRVAIIHAQFESIHPFMDGNGRVGRMLIPMYLYAKKQIDLPCFFISEALERDKLKYYNLLNNTRKENNWNAWIKFFLSTVAKQCDKYIHIMSEINKLYENHLSLACEGANSTNMVKIIDLIYRYPIITSKIVAEETKIPMSSITRYMNLLVKKNILDTDNKSRYRTYICYDLLSIIRP